jgi:hypothetical protein
MSSTAVTAAASAAAFRLDKLGVLIALMAAAGALLQPFALFRANRIVPGEGRGILDALPTAEASVLIAVLAAGAIVALVRTPAMVRLLTSIGVLAVMLVLVGRSATYLTPPGDTFARIAPSGLVVMDDDKGVQPVYNPAPIIREAVLNQYPQIADLLKPVFEKLDLVTLQQLNGRVQVGGETAQAVAIDWLKQNGSLK